MTVVVKDELSRVVVTHPGTRRAELCAVLRFADGLRIVDGRAVVEAEVDLRSTVHRVRRAIFELYGYRSDVEVLGAGPGPYSPRFVVRVPATGEALARRTGLLDRRGRPVRGLPAHIVGGSTVEVEAVWRGAFLAAGTVTEPGRAMGLQVACPGPEAALALLGAARRLGITAKTRDVRGTDWVVVRDAADISALLTRMGAPASARTWEQQPAQRAVRAAANQRARLDEANLDRSARAAVTAADRVERALQILGDDVPEHLAAAGRLRIANRLESLGELGQRAAPPMTKDAVAGRLRRLLAMADRRAKETGVPDTDGLRNHQ